MQGTLPSYKPERTFAFTELPRNERGPSGDLALQLEAMDQMPDDEQMVIREVLESLGIKYQSRRWDLGRQVATKRGK